MPEAWFEKAYVASVELISSHAVLAEPQGISVGKAWKNLSVHRRPAAKPGGALQMPGIK